MWLFPPVSRRFGVPCLCLLLLFALEVQQIPLPLSCVLAAALAAFVSSEFGEYGKL